MSLGKFINTLAPSDRYLLIATLVALIAMIHATNNYVDTYSMLIQTQINATVKEVRYEVKGFSLKYLS